LEIVALGTSHTLAVWHDSDLPAVTDGYVRDKYDDLHDVFSVKVKVSA
jgi:hypothetical protein